MEALTQTLAQMDSDEGMDFVSAAEEEAIFPDTSLTKDKELLGETLEKDSGHFKAGREKQQMLTLFTQESGGKGTAQREQGLPSQGPQKEGEGVIELTGDEQLTEAQASLASGGLQRRSKQEDTLREEATLQAHLTLPSPGQETPTFPAEAAGRYQGPLTDELTEGLDSCQRQATLTGELSKQQKLTQGPKTPKMTKNFSRIDEMPSEQDQEGPVGPISDAKTPRPKGKVTTEEKLTKNKEIGGEMEKNARKSPETTRRSPRAVGEGPTREGHGKDIQVLAKTSRDTLSKHKKGTETQEMTPQTPSWTQKEAKTDKERILRTLPLSETSGTDTEMEDMLRQTEALEAKLSLTLENMRERAQRDSDYADTVQQFLHMDWQPTVVRKRSQHGKPDKEWKGPKKQTRNTEWSTDIGSAKERDRSPLKPHRNQAMLEEEAGVEEETNRNVGWSLRSPNKAPRHMTRKTDEESVESGLERETGCWRGEAENRALPYETFSEDDLISEQEYGRGACPSDQTGDNLSDRQDGKKDPRLEDWEEQLTTPPDLIHQVILMPPYSENDMVKLWGYIAGHMALEPALATRDFSKFGQQKIFGMLTKTKRHLLEVLKENSSVSDNQACRLRSLALAVTGKIICMRVMKKTKSRYPEWLQEEEMARMLQGVQRHWERRVAENGGLEPILSPLLKDMGDPRSIMTAPEFVDWLAAVVSHLKLRRKELREQMRPGTLTPTAKGNLRTPERRRLQERARQRAMADDSTDGDGERSRKAWHGGQGASPVGGMPPQTGELGGKGRRENRSPGLARSSEPAPTWIVEAETKGKAKEKQSRARKSLFQEGKGTPVGGGEEHAIPTSIKASWGSEVDDVEKADKERQEGVEKKRRRWEEPSKEIGQTGPKEPDTRPVPDLSPVKEMVVTGAEEETVAPSEGRPANQTGKRNGTESEGPGGGGKDNEEAGGRNRGTQGQSNAAKQTLAGQKGSQGVDGDRGGYEGQTADRGTLREGEQEQVVRPKVPKGQLPAGGVSYARAVASGTGTGGGSAQGFFRGLARSELDILEDEDFLQRFYESIPEEQDPRQRYVVRFQYKGEDPNKVSRQYVGREILMNQLGIPTEHIMALIIPPGSKEIDICLASETNYQRFWEVLRIRKRLDNGFLEDYNIIPLFRGDTRVLTVSFRTTVIPPEDVAKWLSRRCRVLMEAEKKVDENGFWTGEYKLIVALYRDPVSGRIRHLPKYFFLGADRGITRYGGQPPACFRCGGFDHMRKSCPASLCSKCGTRGHSTADCKEEVSCSLCAKRGHVYRFCPESELNIRNPEAFQREWERANRAREAEEGAKQQDGDTRNRDPDQAAGGPMGGKENMSKRKRREEARAASREEERRKMEVQAACNTANRFAVLQEEEEETMEMEMAAEDIGQGKSQRRDGKRTRTRKQKESTVQIPAVGGKTTDKLYVQQRKMRVHWAALVSEREWWEDRQKAKPTVEGEKSIQELREAEKELRIDLEILDSRIEGMVMREWEKEEEEEEKREKERRKGKETEGETLTSPDLIQEEAEAEVGQEKANKRGKEKHGLVPDPPDPPDGEEELTDQLQLALVGQTK